MSLRHDRPPPRAAYIHVPFCARRCGYCNFAVVAGRGDLVEPYLEALAIELAELKSPRPVDTLYIGGGTPTQLNPAQLGRLLQIVTRWFPLNTGGEFSVEANPADFDRPRADPLRSFGVNRISLGAQSFNQEKLRTLERDHTPDHVRRAYELARSVFTSVSLDLIFAAPGESLREWQDDLTAAVQLAPDHVSTYGLTFERGTTFYGRLLRGELSRSDEDLEAAMYLEGIETLSAAGLEHYEVSNFARKGHRCRHNEVYWAADEYYAAGPGAARYVHRRRETNHRSTFTYIKRVRAGRSPVAESETLDDEDRAREALVLAMRRIDGVDRRAFSDGTGFAVNDLFGPLLDELADRQLVRIDGERICLSRQGLLVSDSIWSRLLRC